MSTEATQSERDPFWTHDTLLAEEARLRDGPTAVRAKVHVSDETYPRFHSHTEIVPITDEPGTRRYVMAHPYILVPDLTLRIGLYPEPDATGAVGEVLASSWEGMRHEQIGSAQAWYYPADHILVFWELLLHDRYRAAHVTPSQDAAYQALWHGFEDQLLALFPEAWQIATPSWDPDFDSDEWRAFLAQLGYQPHPTEPRAYIKAISPSAPAA